jgi:DNA-binding response OmpR family regulator
LTAKGTPEDLARGLGLGADDYVAKPIVLPELLARIKARLRSEAEDNQTILLGDLQMNLRTHEVLKAKEKIDLSAQEFKLLHYLMSNPNRVLTRDVILSRIWGVTADVETRVVDVYIGYLRKKIDSDEGDKYIRSVRGFGYMLKVPTASSSSKNGKEME